MITDSMLWFVFWANAVASAAWYLAKVIELHRNRRLRRRLLASPREVLQNGYRDYTTIHTLSREWRGGAMDEFVELMRSINAEEAQRLLSITVLHLDSREVRRLAREWERALLASTSQETGRTPR